MRNGWCHFNFTIISENRINNFITYWANLTDHQILVTVRGNDQYSYHSIYHMTNTAITVFITWPIQLSQDLSHDQYSYHSICHMTNTAITVFITWTIQLSQYLSHDQYSYHSICHMTNTETASYHINIE